MEKIIFVEEQVLYEEYLERYQGESLTVLVDRRKELQDVVGSDPLEIQVLSDLIKSAETDMDIYQDYR